MRAVVVAFVMVLGCAGCGFGYRAPSYVRVYSEGLAIEGADGSFRLASAEPQAPPYFHSCGNNTRTSIRFHDSDTLVGRQGEALELGARRVRVLVPGRAEPLHGVLALCDIPEGATGQGTDLLSLTVTPEHVSQVESGQPVVIAERYPMGYGSRQSIALDTNTWILWLSRDPL